MSTVEFFGKVSWGAKSALRGIRQVSGNPGVKKAYGVILLGLFVVTAVLTVGGGYALFRYTETLATGGLWATLGVWALRIVGLLVLFLAAPLLSITLCNLLFPVFSEIPFLAGLDAVAPARSQILRKRSGLPLSSTMGNSLRRLARLIAIAFACFALGFIPVLGPLLAPVLSFYWTARLVGWEMLDPYFDREGMHWNKQKKAIKSHAAEVLGLGLVCAPLLSIPLVGPLFFGLLQAGTAGFVVDLFPEGSPADEPSA